MLKSGTSEVVFRALGEQDGGMQVDWTRFVREAP